MPVGPGYAVAGRYRLERIIARGGMGSVWVGHDDELDRPVALKVIGTDLEGSEGSVDRFKREARLAAKLRSPHVVEIFDYGVDPEVGTYLVQELLQGQDLSQRLTVKPILDALEATVVVQHAAKALAAAHDAGIIHRDLKPANLFLSIYESEVFVKVLDFGVAKARESESTKTGELLGTLHYMSPEQTRGAKNATATSDLWSLAVIAYEALTGDRPFHGKGPAELVTTIRSAKVPSVRRLRPDLPDAIDAFFERALAREPAERFQTASELAKAFKSALAPTVTTGASLPVTAAALAPAAPPPTPAPAPAPAAKGSDAHWWAAFGGVAATILLGFCSLTTRGGHVETPEAAPTAEAASTPGERGTEPGKEELLAKVTRRDASYREVQVLWTLCARTGDEPCRARAAEAAAGLKGEATPE